LVADGAIFDNQLKIIINKLLGLKLLQSAMMEISGSRIGNILKYNDINEIY
jgi:hypothetical protein